MCIQPYKKTDGDTVPCGRCPPCKARRVSAWSFRLIEQEKQSKSAIFLTLTYDTAHIPITNKRFLSLRKKDIQLFLKRLRKNHDKKSKNQIKYYACGEYGGRTYRPHYHIILFNADKELIPQSWGLGQIHIGNVSGASIGYTLKYINKPKRVPAHKNDDRIPEFSLMSKRLGRTYSDNQQYRTWHREDIDNRMYLNLHDGKKIAMPRYYKEHIYTKEERERIANAYTQKLLHAAQFVKEHEIVPQARKRKAAIKHAMDHQFNNAIKNDKL